MDRKAIKIIKQFIEKLRKDISIDKVLFFGSRIGSDYLKHSDIDLIIVSRDFLEIDFTKRISMMYDYWQSNYDVDFFCYTPKEFAKLSKMINIVSEALKKGIEIEV